MNEETRKATNIISRIKRLLYNYDMALVEAKGQLDMREASMKRYKNDKRKSYVRKYLAAKIDCDRLNIYISEINQAKNDLYDNLNLVLDTYNEKYKNVFILYFIEGKSYEDIATITSYSREAIRTIIRRQKNDILDIFV